MAASGQLRAYWKGYLRLSLVSVAVEMYAATASSDTLALHQIHKPSGKRVRYEKVVPGLGPVDPDDIVKGFEIDKDTYVVLTPEEVDEIKLESKQTIDLVQFVERREIDPRYFDRPYYLVPDGDVSTEGFAVIREALDGKGCVGLGQLAMRGREYLVAVMPFGRGLLLETLRYQSELKPAEKLFDGIAEPKLDKELISLAGELIDRKAAAFDAAKFKDSYADALRDLVERKRRGKAIVSAEDEKERRPAGQVIDLMEALKRSVGSDRRKGRPTPAGRARSAPRARKRG